MSDSSASGLYAVCGSFIGLSTVAVGLRFYGRKHQGMTYGIDDWTALFGVVTFIGAASCAMELVVQKAVGYDTDSLTSEQQAARAKTWIEIEFAYDFLNMHTLACAKLSALFLYQRIFCIDRHSWLNRTILATALIIGMWYIAFDFLSLYQCRNHFNAWWTGGFEKYCDLNPVWAKGLAISDFLLDTWVLVLPIPSIWRLNATIAKRLAILGVFLLAFIGLGAAIARIVFFTAAKAPSQPTLYFGILEPGISITVVNLPSIWHLCTSTIPSNIARSLRSVRSLGSEPSQKGAGNSTTEVATTPWAGDAESGLRTDVQAGDYGPFAMRDLESRGWESLEDLPQNVIHVSHAVEQETK